MNAVEKIVEEVAVEHRGGEPYFDALDAALTTPEVFKLVLRRLQESEPTFGETDIIVSGRWGRAFAKWYNSNYHRRCVLVVPGGLRHSAVSNPLRALYGPLPSDRTYAFLDDSLYLGRTMRAVEQWVSASEAKFAGAFVAYDGSPVRSLYRFHDATN